MSEETMTQEPRGPAAPAGPGAGGPKPELAESKAPEAVGTAIISKADVNENPETFALRVLLAAPPARVFRALSEGGELGRWFCVQARANLGAGGEFELNWGSERTARWKVASFEADKSLDLLRPEPVRFRLKEEADGRTCLEVSVLSHADANDSASDKALWAVHLMYLKAYLENGLDLRESDKKRTWLEGYINGMEPA